MVKTTDFHMNILKFIVPDNSKKLVVKDSKNLLNYYFKLNAYKG